MFRITSSCREVLIRSIGKKISKVKHLNTRSYLKSFLLVCLGPEEKVQIPVRGTDKNSLHGRTLCKARSILEDLGRKAFFENALAPTEESVRVNALFLDLGFYFFNRKGSRIQPSWFRKNKCLPSDACSSYKLRVSLVHMIRGSNL